MGRSRLIVAGVVALVALVVCPDVFASAGAWGGVSATDAAVATSSCHQDGRSGPKFGRVNPVVCGMPEHGAVLRCIPREANQACKVRLIVRVDGPAGFYKHDLGAAGELGGELFRTKKCDDARSCEIKRTIVFACTSPITGEAIGYQYARRFFGQREKESAEISVHGELIVEGYVDVRSAARFADRATATCGLPSTSPLEVLLNGVPTSDPLTAAPLASGYGNVSVSPPDAEVRCPYRTDYRVCFGAWQLPRGADVTLTAMPDRTNHSNFAGWRGTGRFSCPSSSLTCTVRVGQVSRVTALFRAPIYRLTVNNTNPEEGAVVPSAFSGTGPTYETLHCGAGVSRCTAYYPLVDAATMPTFNGPKPLSLMGNGLLVNDVQYYIHFVSGCDAVQVVVDGSNRYTVCYYDMTADRTVTVDWTTNPP